jgi:dTMP kinase
VSESPVDLSGAAGLKAILRIRPFRRLWLVLGLSSLGDWLGLLASSIFASQQVSGSAAKGAAFGSVVAVRMLPALIMGPLAGVVADRWDRRYTMVVCDIGRFLLFASIPGITLIASDSRLVVGWAAVATFAIETLQMAWGPAKDASVPNLLPRGRLESANQLTLATTYGATPVLAGVILAGLTTIVNSVHHSTGQSPVNPTHLALYFDALTFLATALTVFFGIKEISGRTVERRARQSSLWREFISGWAYVGKTPLVRGLVLGILGAFAGAGVVVGTAQFYARSLGGGDSTFYILFAFLFVGLALGIVAGPRLVGALSRRRWFGLSIVLAALSVAILAFAWHLVLAIFAAIGVGVGAGMAFLAGTTLLGREVSDDIRGRVFSFIQTGTQLTLLFTVSLSAFVVGLGGSREVFGINVSTTRLLLLAAGVFGIIAGLGALRQMDDKRGVPLLRDVLSSVRGRPLSLAERAVRVGRFIVFEGGEGAGKSTQVRLLAERLRAAGRDVVVTREPGATDVGARIRGLLLDRDPAESGAIAPRAEALLYAADRAHHVATVIRPALGRGAVVISDRYVDSSLAYQGAGRVLPVNEVSWLSAWATGGLKPDLVVLLDVDPGIGLARVADRGAGIDRLEGEALPFHERVRYAFLDLASAEPSRYLVLDASRPPEAVAELVADRVAMMLPEPARNAAPHPSPNGGAPHDGAVDGEADRGEADHSAEATRILEGPLSTVESRSTVRSNRS